MERLTPQLKELLNGDKLKLRILANWSRCSPCKLEKDMKYSNSVENDVIVAAGFSICTNACLFVRTLRATGSKAQVVLLLDTDSYNNIDKVSMQELINCGTQVIDCGHFEFTDKRSRCTLKFVLTYLFMRKNAAIINRAIMVDLFDTVFQSDPFNTQIGKPGELNVIHEGLKLGKSTSNKRYLRQWGYEPTFADKRTYYKCSGYIGGTADAVLRYEELAFELMYSFEDRDDQGLLNYIIYSGMAARKGLTIAPMRKDELVRHSAHLRLSGVYGNVSGISNKNIRAAIVHHYYRNLDFINSVIDACPMKKGQINYAAPYKPV